MRFIETELSGAYIVELDLLEDERGIFARTFCRQEFDKRGLNSDYVQANISVNRQRGTLRGMHYQEAPKAEVKLVQCIKGSLYDVLVDLRPTSETYCRWVGLELGEGGGRLLYVPEGLAHGFQTLEDDTAVYYMMGEYYAPDYARGVRWNDPAFGIEWPIDDPILSEKDRSWPDYRR